MYSNGSRPSKEKRRIRAAGFLLAVFVLCISLSVTNVQAAPRLSAKTKTLTVNQSFTLQLKNYKGVKKPVFLSSNKKVVSLKKISKTKYRVTAKKAGKATITVKAGKKKLKCVVTVQKKADVGAYKNVNFKKQFDMSNGGKTDANPENRMAHNIYSDPDLSQTEGRFKSFLIDFRADHTPAGTYWALCNWSMDLTALKEQHKDVSGGGAYCGLQVRPDGRKAIMSIWNIEYDGKKITPALVYPVRDGNGYFDNEGSGANYIPDYAWKTGSWYRLFLNCYEDEASGHTYVELWIKDLEANKWKEICCYDTKLTGSCLTGGMSQFMENYIAEYSNEVRSMQLANLFVREYDSGKWHAVTSSKLSIDTWWDNKKGTYAFGSTATNLWGITCGYGKDKAVLNSDVSSMETVAATVKLPSVSDLPSKK